MADVRFPVELFQLIAEQSPRPTRKILFTVSKMFHDLVLPMLFSRITMTFGIKRKPERNWQPDTSWTEEETTQLNKYCRTSSSILQHIAENSEFSSVVKHLSIRWYEVPTSFSNVAVMSE